jgi:hypothetical protein
MTPTTNRATAAAPRTGLSAAPATLPPPSPQKADQAVHVAGLRRLCKLPNQSVGLFRRCLETAPGRADALLCPREELAAIRFRLVNDPADLRVLEIENLPQKKHGALDRRKPLEENQERDREGLRQLDRAGGI